MTRSIAFRADVQGLRALAVLLVVLYHAGLPGLPGGFIGVDVFFVVSGFVIAGLLREELLATGRVDFLAFYARRMRRLLPAALTVVVATLAFFWLVYSPLERQRLAGGALATSLYVSNLWFASYATDYFAAADGESPLLHTWSLSVEEQFYIVFPALLVGIHRLGRWKSGAGAAALLALVVASLAACVLLTTISQPWAFFGPLTRAWEFGAGALVAMLGGRTVPPRWRSLGAWLGLGLVALPAVLLSAATPFPGVAALPPVLGTSLLIACHGGGRWIRPMLSHRVAVWLGDHSYGWYLWHWPVLLAMRELALLPKGVNEAAAVGLSLWLAWGMAKVLENPIRHQPRLAERPAFSVGCGVALTLLAGVGTWGALSQAKAEALQPAFRAIQLASQDRPSRLYERGCHAAIHQTEPAADCLFNSEAGGPKIVLFGDSHAAHWFPALESVAQQHGYQLVSLTKSGCPSVSVEVWLPSHKRAYSECDVWRRRAIELIASWRPAMVVLSNMRSADSVARGGEPWLRGLAQTARALDGHADRVLVFGATSRAPFNVPVCLARALARGASEDSCGFAADAQPALWQQEAAVVRGFAHVRMVDVSGLVCPVGRCAATRQGVVVYADDNHLTSAFSATLSAGLWPHLRADGTPRPAAPLVTGEQAR